MRIRVLLPALVLSLITLSLHAQGPSDPAFGLSTDFRNFLTANGYGSFNFQRSDVPGGAYGGRVSPGQAVVNQPVIFIHGNSDSALGSVAPLTGWTSSISYFKSQGYTSAELYATTWGPENPALASLQYHSKDNMMRLRAFIQAVKAYTGATKVDIVCHSMGVTLARKAIKGGTAYDSAAGGNYNLGASLTSSVDTFVGIAGGNRGLTACYTSGPTTPTCSDVNGLYPGYLIGVFGPYDVSSILVDMNATSHYEGSFVYSIWSQVDEVIGYGTIVYGQSTCRIPGQNGEVVFSTVPYGHIGSKDLTGYNQWRMVKYHATN
jgi:triacylglycerol lipase